MNCTSCGLSIPEGQGSSCSMCYGDIAHGRDGYFRSWAEEQERLRFEQEEGFRTWVSEATCTIVMHCPYCHDGLVYENFKSCECTESCSCHVGPPEEVKCYWCKGEATIPAASQNKEAIFND